jgi:hypothetical protein
VDDFSYLNYEDDDISAAIKAVTGDNAVFACIDDEHVFWFVVENEGDTPTYDDNLGCAEFLEDLYSEDQLKEIQAYLEENYKPTAW